MLAGTWLGIASAGKMQQHSDSKIRVRTHSARNIATLYDFMKNFSTTNRMKHNLTENSYTSLSLSFDLNGAKQLLQMGCIAGIRTLGGLSVTESHAPVYVCVGCTACSSAQAGSFLRMQTRQPSQMIFEALLTSQISVVTHRNSSKDILS